ncbi:MAG TPA: APC family permease [Burkholderiales bacterium]|nr:APC family permease [Burkholderiales bacterium]
MSAPAPRAGAGGEPRPTLTVFDAVAMIVGIVIGVGIFKAPAIVAGNVAGDAAFIAVWLLGGLISLVGALVYAELGSAHPHAGGEYYFLSQAYGDWLGFLFAWARMTVVQTGAIAAIAFVFGDYATTLLPLGAHSSAIYAALAVVAITALNAAGTSQSKWVQNALTIALVAAVLVVVASGLSMAPAVPQAAAPAPDGAWFTGLALIFVLLTYGGWNEAAYLTAEMRDTRRNIVKALVIGIVVITVLYLLLNLAYLKALGLAGMRESKAVASDLMKVTWGEAGVVLLGIVVVCASLSTLNATVFTGARTNYALGRDFVIFRALGRWNERSSAPVNALLAQGAISLALVALASFTPDGFQTMVAYTAPAFWLFFMLTGISLFLLRRQRSARASATAQGQPREGGNSVQAAHREDHFRVPLYPLTPLIFAAACAYMLYSSFTYAMSLDPGSIGAMVGIAMLASGVPVLMWAKRAAKAQRS